MRLASLARGHDAPARIALCWLLLVAMAPAARSQSTTPNSTRPQQSVISAMTGAWTGVLEYRDYQSDGRVKLPTWLQILPEGQGLRFKYTYDDGPTKVVEDAELVTIDAGKATYTVQSKPGEVGKDAEVASMAGLDELKNGHGTLILTGKGTENGKAVDVRTTLRIGRNILEILRESRLPGEEFKFRHAYTLTRSLPPAVRVEP